MDEEAKAPRLPAGYNENVLVLLVQNPNVVFAYLELSDNFWGALVEHGQPVLRLYDVTGLGSPAGQPAAEVAVPPFTANWYFRGLSPGRTYTSELGWQDGQGLFVSLLRSNPVSTPSNERVRTQAGKKDSALDSLGPAAAGAPVPRPADALWPRETEEEDAGDLPSSYSS